MIAALTPLLMALGPVTLLLMMGVVFAETGLLIAFFLPGDSLLFTAGILTATGVVHLPFWVMAVAQPPRLPVLLSNARTASPPLLRPTRP